MATAFPLPTEPCFDPEFYQVPDEVRLTSIPEELRRAQKAIDHLRRSRGEALALAAQHEKAVIELRRLYAAQAATLFASIARKDKEIAAAKAEWPVDRQELDHLRTSLAKISGESADYRSQLCEILAGDAGQDCDECGGSGLVADEEMVGDPGAWHGHRIRSVTAECEACFDGRVAR